MQLSRDSATSPSTEGFGLMAPLKILVVEDDSGYRRTALHILEGARRYVASNAAEGIELFRQEKPDITFLDIGLPDQSGLLTLRQMKGINPEAFIVMLTASRLSDDVAYAHESGAIGYIVKPFSRGKVLDYIDVYHQYRQQMAELSSDAREQMNHRFWQMAQDIQEHHQRNGDAKDSTEWKRKEQARLELLAKWRILYIDRSVVNSERVRASLSKLGCMVDCTDSAEDALVMLGKSKYDLAFVDSQLAESRGDVTAFNIRKEHRLLPIVMMLGDRWEMDNPKWRILDIAAFLVKPLKLAAITDIVEREAEQSLERANERYVP